MLWKKINWPIVIAVLLLTIIGFVTLISVNIDVSGDINLGGNVTKQLIFIVLGSAIMIAMTRLDYNYFRYIQVSSAFYVVTIILLVATLLFAPEINNARRWIFIAGVQIQPSEIAKIAVILMTSSIMAMKEKYNEFFLALISFIALLPLCALIAVEPSGSMALFLVILWFVIVFTSLSSQFRNFLLLLVVGLVGMGIFMLYLKLYAAFAIMVVLGIVISIFGLFSKFKLRFLFLVALVVGGLFGGFMLAAPNLLFKHQENRIKAFTDPEANPDYAFNVRQANIAIGSGGILGKGFGNSSQSKLRFLPEFQTDFIFAAYAEQFGLVGCVFLLALYFFLIYRILLYSLKIKEDRFSSMVVMAIAIKFMLELFINVGTNTGIIPATGIPIPLLSYGGTITLMTFFSLGILQSIMIGKHGQVETLDFVSEELIDLTAERT